MNDQFLYQLYEEPDPDFANNLRQTLNRSSSSSLTLDENAGPMIGRYPTEKKIALALLALVLAFAMAVTISPTVRAAVTDIIETIIVRGTTIWVSNDIPAVSGEGETYSVIWTPVNPNEISTNYPVFARSPMWVPSGYAIQERAALFGSMTKDTVSSVLFEWKNKQGDIIQLAVSKGSCPNGYFWETGEPRSDCTRMAYFSVGSKNQPEVITINGQPAVLISNYQHLMNLSDPIQEWNPYRVKYDNRDPDAFFLAWESDGMTFELAAKSPAISKSDLIRFAESIP